MKIIPIHEAKTHLSKYIKQAKSGKPVYIGSFGVEEVMLVAHKSKNKPFKIGIWAHKRKPNAYKDQDLIGPDPDITKDFEDAVNEPFPK